MVSLVIDGGGTATAPSVNAGADVAEHLVNTAFTRTAVENDNGSAITSRAWTITAGPTGQGSTIGTSASLNWTPTQVGTYTLQYSATNAGGTSTDTAQVTVVSSALAPTVDAGSDIASHPNGTQLIRTATENDNGSAITSRAWTITAGPTGVGTTLSTTASFAWTPSEPGTYTLQYSAQNSIGTGTDSFVVTVAGGVATFGYSIESASTVVGPSTAVKTAVSRAIPSSTGTVQTGHAKMSVASGTKSVVFVIYANETVDGVDQPGARLAISDEVDLTSTTPVIVEFPFSGANQITVQDGTKYWVGYSWSNEGGAFSGYRADSNSAPRWEHEDYTFPNPWDPFTAGGVDGNARPLSGPIVAWVSYSSGTVFTPPTVDAGPDATVTAGQEFVRYGTAQMNDATQVLDGGWDVVSGDPIEGFPLFTDGFQFIPEDTGTVRQSVLRFWIETDAGYAEDTFTLTIVPASSGALEVRGRHFAGPFAAATQHTINTPTETQPGDAIYVWVSNDEFGTAGGGVSNIPVMDQASTAAGWVTDPAWTMEQSDSTNVRGTVFYLPNAQGGGADVLTVNLSTDPEELAYVSIAVANGGSPLVWMDDANSSQNSIDFLPFQDLDAGDYLSILALAIDGNPFATGGQDISFTPSTGHGYSTVVQAEPAGGATNTCAAYTTDRIFTGITAGGSIDPPTLSWSTADQAIGAHILAPRVAGGGPGPVLSVDAGADVFLHLVNTLFTRTAEETGSGITARSWTILSGPAGQGTVIGSSATLSWTPTVVGVYELQYSASDGTTTATDSIQVNVSASGGDRMPANPGEALWIGASGGMNHYNVGIGRPGGGTNHDDFDMEAIEEGFAEEPWFCLTENGDVQFQMNVDYGRTSLGTRYARSELRELTASGARAAWNSGSGTHYMKGRSRVMRVAPTGNKPEVCFFQCHDASSDLVRVITTSGGGGAQGLRLRALWTPPSNPDYEGSAIIMAAYDLGQWVDWEMRFVNGRCYLFLNGQDVTPAELAQENMGTTGCYFKTGCYNQANTDAERGGADPGDYFTVELAKGTLETWHTGYPTPTDPVYTGTPSNVQTIRFYLTNTPAPHTPNLAAGFWNDKAFAQANPLLLGNEKSGTATSTTLTETVATSPYWGLVRQFVTERASTSGVIQGDMYVVAGLNQSDSAAAMNLVVHGWVESGDTGVSKGTIFSRYLTDSISLTPYGGWYRTPITNTVTISPGDRVVFEIGFRAGNTDTSPHSMTYYHGGTGPDLSQGQTSNVTTSVSWLELQFTPGMAFDESYQPPVTTAESGRMLMSVC